MKNLRKIRITREISKSLPQEPGIYIFWQDKNPIYVGKAVNLKSRVSSYFSNRLLPKTAKMVSLASHLSFIPVISELEALLLEARLVREYKPQYNSTLKDDKSPLYIRITNDYYPRVITARKGQVEEGTMAYFGPFPSGTSVKFVLKSLRKIFPYSEHKLGRRKCIYAHIGLCSPCPNEIETLEDGGGKKKLRKKYLRNIGFVNAFLSGRLKRVRNELETKMRKSSGLEKFEEAATYKDAVYKFDYITQPITEVGGFLKNPNLSEDIRGVELKKLSSLLASYIPIPRRLGRIECYDVAHLAGTNPAASMVVFINAAKDPASYRHFRIRSGKPYDDISSLSEVAKRRIKHLESWGRPELIIVDGGKAQVSVFRKLFDVVGISVVGISKRKEALVIPQKKYAKNTFAEIALPYGPVRSLITRIRDEAHRFARRYHHKLVTKRLLNELP